MNSRTIIIIIALLALIGALILVGSGIFSGSRYDSTDISGLPAAKSADVVELKNGDSYDLTARYVKKEIGGREYRMLAYNDSIPGPLLKIPQGAEVTVRFNNETDMDTMLHSHGVRMENAFDGSQATQDAIKPGESFSYTLKFPDVGMYWYHPHVREDYQQELGLYGNYLVVPKDAGYWSPVNREVPVFLDDILIESGAIDISKSEADRTLMGRFGNVMLVNGTDDYSLSVNRGEVIRMYVTNAANARPFNFAIAGTKMKLVGADGGAYERETWTDSVILQPSERAIIEVLFDKTGTFALENKTPNRTYALGTVRVNEQKADTSAGAAFDRLREHADTIASIDPFRPSFNKTPDKRIALAIGMSGEMMNMQGMGGGHMMPDGTMMGGSMSNTESGGIEWEDGNPAMNMLSDADAVTWKLIDQDTGAENMDIHWAFAKGTPAKIRILNNAHSMHPMQHPIHFHGQRFLIIARNGIKETNLVWKDTVSVPSGEAVDILLDTSNPGTWMAHCHIAEHLEAGMMMKFSVQ